jgi:hypothetical protein
MTFLCISSQVTNAVIHFMYMLSEPIVSITRNISDFCSIICDHMDMHEVRI